MVKRVLLFGGVVTLFCGLFSCAAYADDPVTASSTFSIDASNVVLQITAPATATINLQPISSAAVFNSTNVTVNVATNNATGYTFTMDVSSTDLAHSTITGQDAPVIPTLSTAATQANFPANAWGYKAVGDNYVPVISSNSSPVWKSEGPTNGTDHIITLGASVNGTKPSGTYTNTLVFNAVANSLIAHDSVSFNGNGADSGDMTSDAISVTSGDSTLLPANKFTKSGYRFLGWNTSTSGTGLSYADEGEYNAVSTNYNQNITLYAMWSNLPDGASTSGTTPGGNPGITISRAYEIAYTAAHKGMWEKDAEGNGYTQISDGVYHNRDVRWDMQGMTPEICNSVTAMHDDYQALDIRDWKLYHITKTLDGKCWMTQNLDFNITSTTLTSEDTDLVQYDVGNYNTAGGYSKNGDVISWTPTRYTIDATSVTSNWIPGWSTDRLLPYSADVGDWYHTDVWYAVGGISQEYNYLGTNGNSRFQKTPYPNNGTHGHVGNYYNYPALIAVNDSSSFVADGLNDTSLIPQNSICPRGWRLMSIYNGHDDFSELYNNYMSGSYTQYNNEQGIMNAPLYFIRGGNIYGGVGGAGESGFAYYNTPGGWSAYGYPRVYYRGWSNGIGVASPGDRYDGTGVRCLAR